MNAPRSRFWLTLGLLGWFAPALPAATPVIGAQLFQDTNVRIDDLFQYRDNPPKRPGPLDNPFRTSGVTAPEPPAAVDPNDKSAAQTGPRETPDEYLLRMAYGSLSFGGLLQVGDRPMVVINKATYKEGGLLIVKVNGAPVYLRIIALTTDSITLALNEARITLHF
jgi:hypothetical protein